MQLEKGLGSSNGVRYLYTLNKHEWYAVYECCLHRALLDKPGQTVKTKEFSVYGKKWSIRIKHRENGDLVASLHSRNRQRVNVYYTCALLDHTVKDRNVTRGSFGDFWRFNGGKEVVSISPVSKILDSASNFLDNDFFILRMDLRIRCLDNESWNLSVDGSTAKCEWKIRHLREMSPSVLLSRIFKVRGRKMRLEINTASLTHEMKGLKVFLHGVSEHAFHATGECSIVNHHSAEDNHRTEIAGKIDASSGKKKIQILDGTDLFDKEFMFTKNGWITFSVKLSCWSGLQVAKNVLRTRGCVRKSLSRIDASSKVENSEGSGSFDGCDYAYTLAKDKWYASYELCVNRSLLEEENRSLMTNTFIVNGTHWCIKVQNTKGENLKAFLYSKNPGTASVHFALTLLNFTSDKNSIRKGARHTFTSNDSGWGFDLISSAKIKDGTEFLKDNFFLVRVDLRLIHPDTEDFDVFCYGSTARCEWKLKYLKEMSPWLVATERFQIANTELQLALLPSGETGKDSLAVHLVNWGNHNIRARCEMEAVSHSRCEDDREEEFLRIIAPSRHDGICDFLEPKAFDSERSSFVKDGWITFVAKITLYERIEFEEAILKIQSPSKKKSRSVSLRSEPTELMTADDGTGVFNDVDYTFKLNNYKWYAAYECRIHRSLLENTHKEINTDTFEANYRNWSICVKHRADGRLCAFLYNESSIQVVGHYSFTLVNFDDATKSKREGCCRAFLPSACRGHWGFNLASAADVLDPAAGFLQDDYFLVRLALRIRSPENECWTVIVNGKTATCRWKVRYLKELNPGLLRSNRFKIGDTEWCLSLCADGGASDAEDLGLCLINKNEQDYRVRCEFRAMHAESQMDRVEEFTQTIKAGVGWGCLKFLKGEELTKEATGFLKNDWITLIAHVALE